MKLAVSLFAATLAITGCSTQRVTINEDVSYQPWQSAEAIETVRFPATEESGNTTLCVAKIVSNNSVTLQDSSGSFWGPYTGRYYQNNKSFQAGGGDVIIYQDDRSIVARGVSEYAASAFVNRAVRFTLTVSDNQYEFSNIEQAQMNTGVAPNTGYHKIGAWSGADPDKAVSSLKLIAQEIDSCRAE